MATIFANLCSKMPLLHVGDEVQKGEATAKAVRLAERLGRPVIQARLVFVSFLQAPRLAHRGARVRKPSVPENPTESGFAASGLGRFLFPGHHRRGQRHGSPGKR